MLVDDDGRAVFPIRCMNGVMGIGHELYDGRLQCSGASEVVFDWQGVGFVSLSTLTTLVALQLKIASLGYRVSVVNPDYQDVDRYISRMDYFNQIGLPRIENFLRHDEGDRFLPIEKFSQNEDRSSLPERVSRSIISHTPLSFNLKAAVDYMFGEIMDNVCEHARSSIGGYIGVQFYPAKHSLELCITDGGCGIPDSLRRNALFANMEDDALLPRALEYGIGENVAGERGSKGYGRGKGLAFIKNMIACSGGTLRIVSGNAGITISNANIVRTPNVCFPGTSVSIEMPTYSSREVTAEELFSGMESSALLDELLEKYGTGGRSSETVLDVLW